MGANWFYDELKSLNKTGKFEEQRETVCPICKTQKSDFLDTLFVGCSNCYKVFCEDVERLVQNYHGSCEHVGKVPERVSSALATRQEIERLERMKQQAVLNEDYLLADTLLQKIKSLKGEG